MRTERFDILCETSVIFFLLYFRKLPPLIVPSTTQIRTNWHHLPRKFFIDCANLRSPLFVLTLIQMPRKKSF